MANLIVGPGITTIATRVYYFDTIHIQENGVLKVADDSYSWMIINVKELILEGSIEFINFRRGVGTVSYTFPNGEIIEHTFKEALGGLGGNGSGNGKMHGGLGFESTNYYGGGGGSGAYYLKYPLTNFAGIDATGHRGAASPGISTHCFGGNGARPSNGHGGLVCIIVDKITFGSSSKVILKGTDGLNGATGGYGSCYSGGSGRYWAGGGGGGGASGANGGKLILKCSNIINEPYIDIKAGKGGLGGLGGKSDGCYYYGQDGTSGDDGDDGEWI